MAWTQYAEYGYPTELYFEKIIIWMDSVARLYFAMKVADENDWTYFSGNAAHGLVSGSLLVNRGTTEADAQTNYWRPTPDGNDRVLGILPGIIPAKYIRIYVDDANDNPTVIHEFKPSSYFAADEIITGHLRITDDFASPPKISVISGGVENLRIGDLNGYIDYETEIYGIAMSADADPSDAENFIAIDPINGFRIVSNSATAITILGGGDISIQGDDEVGNKAEIIFDSIHHMGATTTEESLGIWTDDSSQGAFIIGGQPYYDGGLFYAIEPYFQIILEAVDKTKLVTTVGAKRLIYSQDTSEDPLHRFYVDGGFAEDILQMTIGEDYVEIENDLISPNITNRQMTGFQAWTSGSSANTYTITGGGEFQLDRDGYGYIDGKRIDWSATLTTGALNADLISYIYIDSAGAIQVAETRTDALYTDNIVLFEVHYDGTNYHVVKDNHPYGPNAVTSNYMHHLAGTVLTGSGAVISRTASGTGAAADDRRLDITANAELEDHGLQTTVSALSGAALVLNHYYTDGAGDWKRDSMDSEFPMEYNNAGTPTTITVNQFGVFRIYISKDNIETSTPTYYSVMHTAKFPNHGQADDAISAGVAEATGPLADLEFAQLGYVIVKNNAAGGYIVEVIVAKSTLTSSIIGAGGSNTAGLVTLDVTNFDGSLSASDTNVQAAMETLDDIVINGSGSNTQVAYWTDSKTLSGDSDFTFSSGLLEVGNIGVRGIIRTAVFQKDIISVIGGNLWVRPADVLSTDMTAADNSTLTIEGNEDFSVGDFLRIKDGTDDEWMEVTNIGSAPTYTVTRDKASGYGANANPAWKKGASVINFGSSGDGGIYMTSSEANAPFLEIYDQDATPWSGLTTHVRLGNLNGSFNFSSDAYGIGIGNISGEYLTFDDESGNLVLKGSIIITGGSGIASLSDAGNLVTVNEADVNQTNLTNSAAAGATVGANWASNLSNRPTELTDGRVSTGINSSGVIVSKVIPATNTSPSGAGLYLGADFMGYYDSSNWKTYMDSSGNFYLGGTSGTLQWDGSNLTIDVSSGDAFTVKSGGNIAVESGGDILLQGDNDLGDKAKIIFNTNIHMGGTVDGKALGIWTDDSAVSAFTIGAEPHIAGFGSPILYGQKPFHEIRTWSVIETDIGTKNNNDLLRYIQDNTSPGTPLHVFTVDSISATSVPHFTIAEGKVYTSPRQLSYDPVKLGAGTDDPVTILEAYNDDTHPILTITAAHATDYDPQIQFRTDASPTVKFSMGVDAADDNFKIFSGTGIGGTTEFVIDTTGRIGVGVTPGTIISWSKLDVQGSDITAISAFDFSDSDAAGGALTMGFARNTQASPATVVNGDRLGFFMAQGHDGSNWQRPATITFTVDGAVSGGVVPTRISFDTGSALGNRTERLAISSTGIITISGLTASSDVQTNASKELVSTSDKRLKKHLGYLEDGALEKVMQMTPAYYAFKSDLKLFSELEARTLGFYAQDMNLIQPEAAPYNKKEDEWGFNGRAVLALTVKAIQELNQIQKTETEQLKLELQLLKKK